MSHPRDASIQGATPPCWVVPLENDKGQINGFMTVIGQFAGATAAETFNAAMLDSSAMGTGGRKQDRQAARLKGDAAKLGTEAYALRRRAWDECMNGVRLASQRKAG